MFKKIALNFTVLLGLVTSVSADITSHLDGYTAIECTISEKPQTEKKKQKKPHSNSHSPHPNIVIDTGISTNWSGYVSMTNVSKPKARSVSQVSGTWTIPALLATPDTAYSAIWVGIDGYSDSTVEQIGTEQVWVNGAQQNIVWYEMYPAPSQQITGFPANIGDVIEAEVEHIGGGQFVLSIINHTQSVYTTIPKPLTRSPSAQRKSAEWIVEAPYSSGILPLADFQTVYFTNCQTVINGVTGPIASTYWETDDITMVSQGGAPIKAVPSNLSSDYTSFTVTWNHE